MVRGIAGRVVDERDYPVLFGTTELPWGPMDVRFSLLSGEVDERLLARVHVVPFVGDACVVVGFDTGDWGPVGGGLEPGEGWRQALREEAGARLRAFTPFGVLRCHARGAPFRAHLPHPDFDHLYGYGDVELVGPPEVPEGGEHTVAVRLLTPGRAAAFLAGKGKAWDADLYRLAARLRAR